MMSAQIRCHSVGLLSILTVFLLFALQTSSLSSTLSTTTIRIGTRPSPLARKQAENVANALKEVHPNLDTEFVALGSVSEHKSTKHSATQAKPLAQTNVDFTGVIDDAIIAHKVDIGVHSLKDIPPDDKWFPNKLCIACCLPRACPLDVLVAREKSCTCLSSLPPNARVGSASTRRQSQLLHIRPDLQLINLRGNVQTRLEHLKNGLVDALVMARAGLDRLGICQQNYTTLDANEIMPAPGQGIVGVVCRKDNDVMLQMLQSINDEHASLAATAERQVLNTVNANVVNKPYSGRPPLAAFMDYTNENKGWILQARLLRPDGTRVLEVKRHVLSHECSLNQARALGEEVGMELVRQAGTDFFNGSIPRASDENTIGLRNATLNDLDLLQCWEQKEHVRQSIGDYDFQNWNWKVELAQNPSWRFQLIAETLDGIAIGFVQVIDPKEEETHYWGNDCPPNLRAIDIWIGEEEYLRKGYGMQMMRAVLNDYCFSDGSVDAVLVDPLSRNTNAHRFYQTFGFHPTETKWFGPDECLIHRLDRKDWILIQ